MPGRRPAAPPRALRPLRRWPIALVAALVAVPAPGRAQAPSPAAAEAGIRAVLDTMVAAWNADDLEGHVAAYSADATYTVGDGVRRGRPAIVATLDGFRTADGLYGELRFEDVAIRMLGAGHALVTGRYVLAAPEQADRAGRFTLVMALTADGWRAIHDHSS